MCNAAHTRRDEANIVSTHRGIVARVGECPLAGIAQKVAIANTDRVRASKTRIANAAAIDACFVAVSDAIITSRRADGARAAITRAAAIDRAFAWVAHAVGAGCRQTHVCARRIAEFRANAWRANQAHIALRVAMAAAFFG